MKLKFLEKTDFLKKSYDYSFIQRLYTHDVR